MSVNSYCLLCRRSIREEGSLAEMFYVDDCICSSCRGQMPYFPRTITVGKLKIEGLYLYDKLLREALIQFKEYNDEALYPLFLYPHVQRLKRKYRGYHLMALPSSAQALKRRGFKAVELIFSLLEMPVIEGFYKKSDVDQKSRSFKDRQLIRSQIALKADVNLAGKKILLVDDIVTSGATMQTGYRLVSGRADAVNALTLSYNRRFLPAWQRFLAEKVL
jgi:predicted amidophosphoribosyltransferase